MHSSKMNRDSDFSRFNVTGKRNHQDPGRHLWSKTIRIAVTGVRYEPAWTMVHGKSLIHMSSRPSYCTLVTTDGMEDGNVSTHQRS
jgi:hypothetical protein